MKIAIIHHQLKLKGGMETYLLNLIHELNRQKDLVSIHIYKKVTLKNLPCAIKRHNLFYLPSKLRKFFFGWNIHKSKEMQQYDLRISLMRAVNQDIIICGGTHLAYLEHTHKKPTLLDNIEIKLETKAYQSAVMIVVHSSSLKNELVKYYNVPESKVVCLYPPIDTVRFHQRNKSDAYKLRELFKIDRNKTVLLFPSTGHERKGFSLLVEALKSLPVDDFELVVAGDPIPNNQLPNCRYVGFVEDMTQLYSLSDATVLPSYYEPFGLVAMESLYCGTPVILSKYVGAIDLVKPQYGIVLNELTAECIANAFKAIRANKIKVPENFAESVGLCLNDHVSKLKSELLRMKLRYETEKKATS